MNSLPVLHLLSEHTLQALLIPSTGKLTFYCQGFNYLFDTYASNNMIFNAVADIMNYQQLQKLSTVDYSQLLWIIDLHWGLLHDKHGLKITFSEAYAHQPERVESSWAKGKSAPPKSAEDTSSHKSFQSGSCSSGA